MSKRLLQRGRYPKVPTVPQQPNTGMQQQVPPGGLSFPPASEVPFYNVQPEQQAGNNFNTGNAWQPQIFTPPVEPQQIQTLPHQPTYWQGDPSFASMKPPENDSWNQPMDNTSENPNGHPSHPHFQHTEAWQQPQYQYQQPPGNVYDNQLLISGHTLPPNTNPINTEYLPQNNWNSANISDSQNQNCSQPVSDLQQPAWDYSNPNISQVDHLQWTYNTHQNYDQPQSQWQGTGLAPNSGLGVPTFSEQSVTEWPPLPQIEPIKQPDSNYLPQNYDGVKSNHDHSVLSSESANNVVENVPQFTFCSKKNGNSHLETLSNAGSAVNEDSRVKKDFNDLEHDTGSLSAFFNNDVGDQTQYAEATNNSHSNSPSVSSYIEDTHTQSHLEESVASLQIIDHEINSVKNEKIDENVNNLTISDVYRTSSSFVQNENIGNSLNQKLDAPPLSPILFVEEPLNQEVLEPGDSLLPLGSQIATKNDGVESPDEPLNQQVPSETSILAASLTQERIVISPREGSPFKPPLKTQSVKATVIQQESSTKSLPLASLSDDQGVVQEVNLETVPDNLERPPDYDELRKHSWHTAHRHHLQNQSNNSPSTSLWDNPDIPCITLAPAAPPLSIPPENADKEESFPDRLQETAQDLSKQSSPNLSSISPVSEDVSSSKSSLYSDKNSSITVSTSLNSFIDSSTCEIPNKVTEAQPETHRIVNSDMHSFSAMKEKDDGKSNLYSDKNVTHQTIPLKESKPGPISSSGSANALRNPHDPEYYSSSKNYRSNPHDMRETDEKSTPYYSEKNSKYASKEKDSENSVLYYSDKNSKHQTIPLKESKPAPTSSSGSANALRNPHDPENYYSSSENYRSNPHDARETDNEKSTPYYSEKNAKHASKEKDNENSTPYYSDKNTKHQAVPLRESKQDATSSSGSANALRNPHDPEYYSGAENYPSNSHGMRETDQSTSNYSEKNAKYTVGERDNENSFQYSERNSKYRTVPLKESKPDVASLSGNSDPLKNPHDPERYPRSENYRNHSRPYRESKSSHVASDYDTQMPGYRNNPSSEIPSYRSAPSSEIPSYRSATSSEIPNYRGTPSSEILNYRSTPSSETPNYRSTPSSEIPSYPNTQTSQDSDTEHDPNLKNYHNHSSSYREKRSNPAAAVYDPQIPTYQNAPNSQEKSSEPPRQRFADNRYDSFDERNYYSDREGSRPSSRMSLHEPTQERMYRDSEYKKAHLTEYERPPSRMSESEVYRGGRQGRHPYYEQQYAYPPYSQDDEYYKRSRNYRGYEYDPYRPETHPYYSAAYYDPYRYGYSSYNYGFYDELYRNDPRYRQQVEDQYREYYKKIGYEAEYEKARSVHSGRSSANELTKEIPLRYPEPDGDSNGSEYSAYNQQYYPYGEQPSQASSLEVSDDQIAVVPPAARLTPAKYSFSHPFAHFSANGLLITVMPPQASCMQPSPVEIHDMKVIMEQVESFEELKNYQGPLVRGETHKNDIIDFCLQKIKYYKEKEGIPDRESYILLWELMVLLLRQNGSVAGSDIAELLLKDHEVLRPLPLKLAAETPLMDSSPADAGDHTNHVLSGDTSSPDEGIVVTRDKTILNANRTVDVDKVTRKFREFLLFGHKKDALEWAMKHGLWGHALFLASKLDLRTYANVMTRFANSLPLNDPLQTLYQLMSGRQPAAVTSVADKQWSDWRPHLAMILSNPSTHADVDSRSITTLGDTLANRGCLPAAHFCYLMAQVEFGSHSQKNSKMVLLNSNHLLPFEEFATNEAIQCTEIYEYAQSLANPGFMLNHLQVYKFIYASRLIDYGFLQEALHYCEVISQHFLLNPNSFSFVFIKEVYELANKLKYNDPHFLQGQGEWEDQDDPEWLKKLYNLIYNFQDGSLQPVAEYAESLPDTNANVENYVNSTNEIQQQPQQQQLSTSDIQNQNYYSQPSQQSYYQNTSWIGQDTSSHNNEAVGTSYDSQPPPPTNSFYGTDPSANQWNVSNEKSGVFEANESAATVPSTSVNQTSNSSFDFYGSNYQQNHTKQPNRERTNSNSSIGTQRDRHDSTISSGSGYGGVPTSSGYSASNTQKSEKKEEKSKSQVGKSWLGGIFSRLLPRGPNQMILPDDKNPSIVWDTSKNSWINTDGNEEDVASQPYAPPTDVELMNNTNPTQPQAPLSNATSPQSFVSPSSNFGSPPSGSPGGGSLPSGASPPIGASPPMNKFQRPKVKGMRQNYVDILNPSNTSTNTSSAPDALFPPPPMPTSGTMFIPSMIHAEENPVDFVTAGQPSYSASSETGDGSTASNPPMMFDPAEFNSRRPSINTLRHSVGPARRTYPT